MRVLVSLPVNVNDTSLRGLNRSLEFRRQIDIGVVKAAPSSIQWLKYDGEMRYAKIRWKRN